MNFSSGLVLCVCGGHDDKKTVFIYSSRLLSIMKEIQKRYTRYLDAGTETQNSVNTVD